MWPYGQTPPLEKCEQPDLKHPRAMLQNDICPQNSPRGGRVSPPGPRTNITVRGDASSPGLRTFALIVSAHPYCARNSAGVVMPRHNLVPRARAHLRSAGSKCHGLWDNQKPDATFAASGFLKRMCGRF